MGIINKKSKVWKKRSNESVLLSSNIECEKISLIFKKLADLIEKESKMTDSDKEMGNQCPNTVYHKNVAEGIEPDGKCKICQQPSENLVTDDEAFEDWLIKYSRSLAEPYYISDMRKCWQESARQEKALERERIIALIYERLAELLGLSSSTIEIKRLELLKLADRLGGKDDE